MPPLLAGDARPHVSQSVSLSVSVSDVACEIIHLRGRVGECRDGSGMYQPCQAAQAARPRPRFPSLIVMQSVLVICL